MPNLKPTLTQEEQDRLYEELYIATDFSKFNYAKAKQLLLAGVKASNPAVEKKFGSNSVISNILRFCPQALELLQIIHEQDDSPDKSLIRTAQFRGSPLILASINWSQGPFKLADYLIDVAGVSVDQKDSAGKTALYYLVERATEQAASHTLEQLRYLLNKGASLAITSYQSIPLVTQIKVKAIKELLKNTPQGYLINAYEQQQAAEAQRQAAELRQLYHRIEQQRMDKEFELAQRRQIKPHPVAELLLNISSLFSSTNRYKPISACEEAAEIVLKKQL